MVILKETTPTARKEHVCDLCCCKIEIGEKYHRQTIADGTVQDVISHIDCMEIAKKLDMFEDCDDEGLSSDAFTYTVFEYVRDHHFDKETGGISKDWQLPRHEVVKKILEELLSKKNCEEHSKTLCLN